MRAAGPGQSSLLLLDVIDILNESHIPYAVIGALAASFHGAIRASVDADALVFFQNTKEETRRLLNKLTRTGLTAAEKRGDHDDPIMGVINIHDSHNNHVDLLTGIRKMPQDIFARTVHSPFLGARIRIVGLEDFIAMKVFAGGPHDIEDAKNALQVSAPGINLSLLKKLGLHYGKPTLKKLEILLGRYRS